MVGPQFAVKIEGAEALLKELAELGGNVKKSLRGASKAGGEVIRNGANERAPATRYKRRVISKASFPNPQICEVSIQPGKKSWYLRFFETGVTAHEIASVKGALAFEGDDGLVVTKSIHHPGMAARPFLRPAFDALSGKAAEVVGESLRRTVEEKRIEVAAADEDDT